MTNVLNSIDCVPSNVQSSHQEALLYVFEDNEAVIKMIIKGRSPTMRHVSRTHRVALDWLFDRINLDPKIQIEYIDTQNQLADMLPKGSFTRDEWNHLLCLFNISHFSSTVCSKTMAKRLQQDSREERVTAKSAKLRPMMNLIARTPSFVSSSTSVSPEKREVMEIKIPGVQLLRKRRDRGDPISASTERKLSTIITMSNLWKVSPQQATQSGMMTMLGLLKLRCTSDRGDPMKLLGDRHEKPNLVSLTRKLFTTEPRNPLRTRKYLVKDRGDQFTIGNDETELELSVESRSFVNRVNDQVRKRQKRISNVTEDGEKHSMTWRMFMTVTMESAVFLGKNYLNNCQSIANTIDLTLKQIFDISTRLVSEQDEISGVETIGWENHSWKYMSLSGDERVINLQRTKVYVFSDSVLCLGKIFENTQSNDAWEQRLGWLKSSQNYRNFDRIDGGIRVEYFHRIQYVAAQRRSQTFTVEIRGETRDFHRKHYIYVDVQWHFLWIKRQRKRMSGKCQTRISVRKKIWKRTMAIYWSWFWKEVVLYQWRQSTERMGQYCWKHVVGIRWERMPNFQCYNSIVQRSFEKQRTWKTVDSLCCHSGNDWDYFSLNCFCKQAQSLRSSRRDVWRIRIPSRENGATRCDGTIKFLTRAQCDQDRSSFGLWWPGQPKSSICSNMENELRSCHNKTKWVNFVWKQDSWVLLKLDNTSGLKTLENNFMQWLVVNTLFQEKMDHHNQEDGSKGTQRLGPC